MSSTSPATGLDSLESALQDALQALPPDWQIQICVAGTIQTTLVTPSGAVVHDPSPAPTLAKQIREFVRLARASERERQDAAAESRDD